MENLNRLVNLEILLLYNNEISMVEGIDELMNLTIFNIGNNKITDWEHVMYLRKFKKLQSLNTAGNPCVETSGYRDYLLAFLPQLLYFQYKMITEDKRQLATEKYDRTLGNLQESENKKQLELDIQIERINKDAINKAAFVYYLDNDYLFELMFAEDKEGIGLSTVNDDAQNAYKQYRINFSTVCNELHQLGLKEHKKRHDEIKFFNEAISEGMAIVENQSRMIIDEIIQKKREIILNAKELLKTMKESSDNAIIDEVIISAQDLASEYDILLSDSWTKLMTHENMLHEQLEDVNEVFSLNLKDMVDAFGKTITAYFSQLRDYESEYIDTVNGIISYYLSGIGDDSNIPGHLLDVCGDKDILTNNLAASHDRHVAVLDEREEVSSNGLKSWCENYINKLLAMEAKRNNRQILEISHFMTTQQELINSLNNLHEISLNADPYMTFILQMQ